MLLYFINKHIHEKMTQSGHCRTFTLHTEYLLKFKDKKDTNSKVDKAQDKRKEENEKKRKTKEDRKKIRCQHSPQY